MKTGRHLYRFDYSTAIWYRILDIEHLSDLKKRVVELALTPSPFDPQSNWKSAPHSFISRTSVIEDISKTVFTKVLPSPIYQLMLERWGVEGTDRLLEHDWQADSLFPAPLPVYNFKIYWRNHRTEVVSGQGKDRDTAFHNAMHRAGHDHNTQNMYRWEQMP